MTGSDVHLSEVLGEIRQIFRTSSKGPGDKMATKTVLMQMLRVGNETFIAAADLGVQRGILEFFPGGGPANMGYLALTDQGFLL